MGWGLYTSSHIDFLSLYGFFLIQEEDVIRNGLTPEGIIIICCSVINAVLVIILGNIITVVIVVINVSM